MISIVILNNNGASFILGCLSAIQRNTKDYELILIDNASDDGSFEMLEEWEDEKVILLRNKENLGCPAGRAQALGLVQGDIVVLLDNDTIVTPYWTETLLAHIRRDTSVGIIGPVTNCISGRQQVGTDGYQDVDSLDNFSATVRRAHQSMSTLEVGRLMGFCMAMRRDVISKVGAFDGQFGRYGFEDDDYGWRVRLAGYTLGIAANCFIHHHGSLGGKRSQEQMAEFNAELEAAWFIFRDKWQLQSLNFRQYGQLTWEYGLVRPFNKKSDFIPLTSKTSLVNLVVKDYNIRRKSEPEE